MGFHNIPKPQGMYHPKAEHDACGIGLYAHLKGKASHDIVKKGLSMLKRLDHRGGSVDEQTGDGSGIMVAIPDRFFRKVCAQFHLPEKGRYGVGMIFFNKNHSEQMEIERRFENIATKEGLNVLGWRTVPIDVGQIGKIARESCPFIRQVFIGKKGDHSDLERKLYILRKQVEKWGGNEKKSFYIASLSTRTIVYKGLLTPDQVGKFYLDLQDEDFTSPYVLVHSRFSTNTFPSWERAHPNRYLLHNGEINTIQGNENWMTARERKLAEQAFGKEFRKVIPVLDTNGSDSSKVDNAFEFLVLSGLSPTQASMILIPEPWLYDRQMHPKMRAFYEYHSLMMEPWDGPAAILFTDGKQIGARLDRNGLRPIRYYVTTDNYIVLSSEAGVIDITDDKIAYKDRLGPGGLLVIDIEEGKMISNEEIKNQMTSRHPYEKWLQSQLVSLEIKKDEVWNIGPLRQFQRAFGYTFEDIHKYLLPMVTDGKDPVGSMGNDTPLAVLSDRPQSLFNYFKQLFAQVTNPPIDSIREKFVTSTITYLGKEGNLLKPEKENCRRIRLNTPILTESQLLEMKENRIKGFKSKRISTLFTNELEIAVERLCMEAEQAVKEGAELLILSDRDMDKKRVPIPILLAVSAVHQHLVRTGLRTKASIIADTGETREVHHFAALIGYGADAICPYLVYSTYRSLIDEGNIEDSFSNIVEKYVQAVTDGIIKVMAKMGISTVQSYRSAQIFEAVGIDNNVIDRYFTGTPSQIGGIDLSIIGLEAKLRHERAFSMDSEQPLDSGSDFQWRKEGEHHAFNPETIHLLQWAVRKGDYSLYKTYSNRVEKERFNFLRDLFRLSSNVTPISIDEVEPVESILRRFKTGAMSFGSLSKEAHETLAIGMNRIGAKSNSGEGGEDPDRYILDANGDNRKSRIKQIASGRFGVKSHYLVHADEIQIKMAQGAKPGEGGQLPGNKVYPWVAKVRGSTPGVGLISPPPNHDIYSIEDLAQLIFDLKNANRDARISVKLVSKAGVGTIAAGVAKAKADVIVISGYDGGTGASPKTSIKHTGLPWELGLAETHQTLMLNGLRDRVRLETDGKLMTGKDVVIAALLGAEEFSFGTAPLISIGCVMMRACHLDTCPVGIATQNPKLREKFTGKPEYVERFMIYIAEEVREIMASLGFRTIDEMVGRTDVLKLNEWAKEHWKAKYLHINRLLVQPKGNRIWRKEQDHQLGRTVDLSIILPKVQKALEDKMPVRIQLSINNTMRAVGTIVGSEISKKYGEQGLPEDTLTLEFFGSAGQSFGAFVPKGMTLFVKGDANDYFGKGLSGGKLILKAPEKSPFDASENVIVGNVALYGATGGEVYINGRAGERFAVRLSGGSAVVEGIGDHGCEYMTGGKVIILGKIGNNFGAGMSGGIAYLFTDWTENWKEMLNDELIETEVPDDGELSDVKRFIENHFQYTGSLRAFHVLKNWEQTKNRIVKIIPTDYKQMVLEMNRWKDSGYSDEEARYMAFEASQGQNHLLKVKKSKEIVTN
ncbi:glutamate synthase large subunit [Fervidibacillus halotolerans]|uniref:Glutamate synthase large subunit n=1 Tax=Fervidibacillus halotolerans TaxID=2980027 RepID=A0A9E8M014_9BACI|nr:glutamate synthase large subunit [Fervidibacillus halotolerans]WAA12973.1 glutamate synthase large subunit [Fervidibacillus halotolerans]